MKKIAVFASGSGSNAQKIYDYFKGKGKVHIDCVVCNVPNAKVLDRAKEWGCDTIVISKEGFKGSNQLSLELQKREIDLIVLAGFLWLVPSYLINDFPNKIINIHPALLPKYGGKGMHGAHVHQAVFDAGESESGITIHYINEEYDKGEFVFQATCDIQDMSPQEIAAAVLRLEHYHFPRVIENLLK